MVLIRMLPEADYSDTSPQLFQKFMRLCEQRLHIFIKDPHSRHFTMAELALVFPGSPDPDPLMRIFREAVGQSSVDAFRKGHEPRRARVYRALKRLESVLSLQGRRQDSTWVSELRTSLFNEDERKQFDAHQAAERPIQSSKI